MFHLSVAIGRFFEILLFDIARSIASLVASALIAVAGITGLVLVLQKITRNSKK